MNRNTKKGFTIVELIIVIAVIAVLAAVLIPTFSNLINQAQQAKDTALVSDLNKGLKMSGKEFDTMHDALTAVEENVGINVAKINAVATDSEILWDSVNQCFVYLKGGETEPTYIPDTQKTPIAANEQYKYWQIVEETSKTATYSQYLAGTNYKNDVEVNTGFDAGDNTQISSVKYENLTGEHEVILRTLSGALEVDAPSDTVKHYGKSSKVVLTAVAGESYHELGEVSGDVVITKGHFVLENNAKVGTIKIADTAVANEVKLTNNANSALVVVDADNKISADSNVGSASVKVTDKDAVALIGNKSYKTLKEALAAVNDGDTLTMIADYRIDENTKDTRDDMLIINKKITFDFGNYHIYAFAGMSGYNLNFTALIVDADTVMMASENGGIVSENGEDGIGPYGINIRKGAKLTVKSGTYIGGGTAIQVQKGTLEILDGKFMANPYPQPQYAYFYTINCIDAAFKDGTAKISIKGGSFYKFDPADSKSENPHGEFTTDDCKVNCIDDWYTVIPA